VLVQRLESLRLFEISLCGYLKSHCVAKYITVIPEKQELCEKDGPPVGADEPNG